MRKITTWRPDTHPDTEIEYEWDAALPSEQRIHTPVRVKINGAEQPPGQVVASFNKVRTENERKNLSIADAVEHLSTVGVTRNADEIAWVLDTTTGAVTLTVSGLSAQQRNGLRNYLSARYGSLVTVAV